MKKGGDPHVRQATERPGARSVETALQQRRVVGARYRCEDDLRRHGYRSDCPYPVLGMDSLDQVRFWRNYYERSTVRVPDSGGGLHPAWPRDGAAYPLRGAQLGCVQLASGLNVGILPGARKG